MNEDTYYDWFAKFATNNILAGSIIQRMFDDRVEVMMKNDGITKERTEFYTRNLISRVLHDQGAI